ncbi:MAG: hypothetical protein IKO91_00600 [Oscillospiraceae bacterium]|nr:hypothetical protein [Oscillospiraceae bacterium]
MRGRKIFEAAGWAALALALGIYGGTECGLLPLGRGAAEALVSLLAGAWMLWKAGVVRI